MKIKRELKKLIHLRKLTKLNGTFQNPI